MISYLITGKITFVNNDPELTRTIDIGDNPSQADWIRAGVEIHGLSDKGKIETAAGAFPKEAEPYVPR